MQKWIIGLLVLVLLTQLGAGLADYKVAWQSEEYLLEAFYQLLTTDLDQDQMEEVVLTGKNYTGRETFVYWLSAAAPSWQPVVRWQSPNLFEDNSIIWAVSGRFTTTQNQLLLLSSSRYYLYQYQDQALALVQQGRHTINPLKITAGLGCGDLNGDGRPELVTAKIGKVQNKFYDGLLQVWQFGEGQFQLLAESGQLENIRGLTVGDLDGNGQAEVVVEEGITIAPGDLHILDLDQKQLKERFCLKKATTGAVYALQIRELGGGPRLVTASMRGQLQSFAWQNGGLVPLRQELHFNYGLVALALADLNRDQVPEVWAAGYPRRLTVLVK